MATTFEKLQLKDAKTIVLLNAPASFEPELKSLRDVKVVRDLKGAGEIEFSLAFVTKQDEVDALAPSIAKNAKPDAVIWFAYPKGTSKKYKSEIGRDNGWKILGRLGYEPVRAVAIDEDWSGMRFRRAEFIKTMTRAKKWRMTKAGKKR